MATKEFTVYGRITVRSFARQTGMGEHPPDGGAAEGATQSYTRTRGEEYREFKQTMDLHTNSSTHHLRGCRGQHRLLPRQFIPSVTRASTDERWTAAIRPPNGVSAVGGRVPHLLNPGPLL